MARWPGSTHDQTIFLNSAIFERFLKGEFIRNGRISLLLGDGGYGSESFLTIPLRQTNRTRTRAEILYQESHITTRNVVERLFGQWKKRFPCLWIGMRFRKLQSVLDVIVATAVLHNICKIHGEILPPNLPPNLEARYQFMLEQERAFQANDHTNASQLPSTIRSEVLRNYFETVAANR